MFSWHPSCFPQASPPLRPWPNLPNQVQEPWTWFTSELRKTHIRKFLVSKWKRVQCQYVEFKSIWNLNWLEEYSTSQCQHHLSLLFPGFLQIIWQGWQSSEYVVIIDSFLMGFGKVFCKLFENAKKTCLNSKRGSQLFLLWRRDSQIVWKEWLEIRLVRNSGKLERGWAHSP